MFFYLNYMSKYEQIKESLKEPNVTLYLEMLEPAIIERLKKDGYNVTTDMPAPDKFGYKAITTIKP